MFIELHYQKSGDAFIVNVKAISRVYTHVDSKEVRLALLEDKNKTDEIPTECSRQAVYRIRESYEQVKAMVRKATGSGIVTVDSLEGCVPRIPRLNP